MSLRTWGKISNLLFQFQKHLKLTKKMPGKGYLSDSIVFQFKICDSTFQFFEDE
jgi:hypothetical protein